MDENLGMDLFSELNYDPSTSFNEFIEGSENEEDINDNINHEGENQDDQEIDNEDSESVAGSEDDQNEGSEADDDTSETPPNLFSSVATVLFDEGVLPSLDIESAEIKSSEDLAKVVQSEVQNLYKTKLVDKFGEEGFEFIDKGVKPDVVLEYQDRSNVLNSITEDSLIEDIELSKNVVYEDYLSKGMSPDQASKLVGRLIQIGDDAVIEDAKESLNNLKAYNKAQIQLQADKASQASIKAEKDRVANELKVKNSIYGVNSLSNGPDINKPTQDKVYKLMNTVVGKSPQGEPENALMKARREDPIGFDTKLYYMYELTKGFSDFSKFGKKGKSSAISQLERAYQTNKNDHSGVPGFIQDNQSYDGGAYDGHIINI